MQKNGPAVFECRMGGVKQHQFAGTLFKFMNFYASIFGRKMWGINVAHRRQIKNSHSELKFKVSRAGNL